MEEQANRPICRDTDDHTPKACVVEIVREHWISDRNKINERCPIEQGVGQGRAFERWSFNLHIPPDVVRVLAAGVAISGQVVQDLKMIGWPEKLLSKQAQMTAPKPYIRI